MTPAAEALLAELRQRPLPSDEFDEATHREPLRELYKLGLVNLYEPSPYEWRATSAGKKWSAQR